MRLFVSAFVFFYPFATATSSDESGLGRKRFREEDDNHSEYINPVYRNFPRPRVLQREVTRLGHSLQNLVRLYNSPGGRTLDVYDSILDPELIEHMRVSVREIAVSCSVIRTIQRESVHPEAQRFLQALVRDTRDYLSLVGSLPMLSNLAKTVYELFITTTKHMEIPTLVMQAMNLIERFIFMDSEARPDRGGWDLDVVRFGVDLTDLLPDYFEYPIRACLENRSGFVNELEDRIRAFEALDESAEAAFVGQRDKCLVHLLSKELDALMLRKPSEVTLNDLTVESSLKLAILPRFRTTLEYVWAVPMEFQRARAKLLSDLFAFARQSLSLEERLELVHEFAFINSHEDIEGRAAGPDGHMQRVEMILPRLDSEDLVNRSTNMLDSVLNQLPFIHGGLLVTYKDPESRGDGVLRDWLRQMLERYFRVHDGSDDALETSLATFWEYADDTKTVIRPRRVEEIGNSWRKIQLLDGLTMSGTLLGIAMSKRINPGVRLSPAALALMHDPDDDFEKVAKAEDPIVCKSLDDLRSLEWNDQEAVAIILGDATVQIGGVLQPVTQQNLERYIRAEKYKRTLGAISSEMDHVVAGIDNFFRRGSLEELSKRELIQLLEGDRPLTAQVLANAINFDDLSPRHTHLGQWLSEIIRELTPQEIVRFHTFVTASPRVPTDSANRKWITVRVVGNPIPIEAPETLMDLPTARSCFGLLMVPHYPSKEVLKRKLLYAITESLSIEEY